jgi:hypothetical protein
MSTWGVDARHLVEPVPIEDDLCSELALIEDLGFGARFVLVSHQNVYETGEKVSVIKRKIVLPTYAIPPGVEMTLAFMSRKAVRAAGQSLLRLVKR